MKLIRILITLFTAIFIIATSTSCASGRSGKGTKIGLGGYDARIDAQKLEAPSGKGSVYTIEPGEYARILSHESKKRFYKIHVPPSYDGKKPTPVVMLFHGGGGYPDAVRYQSGMDNVADREGFIVVYPAGSGTLFKDRLLIWNDGRSYKNGKPINSDDIGFVHKILDELKLLFNIDTRRVYAGGFSNGAQFSYVLAKQMPERIAAIACVAGHRPVDGYHTMPAGKTMSVMQISSIHDTYAPYEGGVPRSGKGGLKIKLETRLLPVKATIASWCKHNGCPNKPTRTERRGTALLTLYGPGKNGTEIALWTLEEGGHTWASGNMLPSEIKSGAGPINQDINASVEMWNFFKRHQKTP